MEWLEDHIWPVEFQLTDEMLEIGALIGCAELIRTGCTSFLNGYFHEYVTSAAASSAGLGLVNKINLGYNRLQGGDYEAFILS